MNIETEKNSSPEYPIDNIGDLIAKTDLWHGTGRYQYDENGEVTDILNTLLKEGGFQPRKDEWDINKSMTSTSFARDRLYGRLYADMHLNYSQEPERMVSQQELVDTYTKGIELAALKEYYHQHGSALKLLRAMQRARQTLVKNGRWSRKVNSTAPSVRKVFIEGSDIQDNYPILFGVEQPDTIEPIADYLAKHEVRTTEPVGINKVTYIEVPRDRIEETQELMQSYGYSVPVVAIEDAEIVE